MSFYSVTYTVKFHFSGILGIGWGEDVPLLIHLFIFSFLDFLDSFNVHFFQFLHFLNLLHFLHFLHCFHCLHFIYCISFLHSFIRSFIVSLKRP